MLGSYTPYRDIRPPEACYECGAIRAHFANECPQRFARVLGEVPPGWMLEGRTAVKNAAQWDGAELSPAARADYRRFIVSLGLTSHNQYPVQPDDIAGAAPPPPRRVAGGHGQ